MFRSKEMELKRKIIFLNYWSATTIVLVSE